MSSVSELLAFEVQRLGLGTFSGEEFGGGEAVLYFDVTDRAGFLQTVKALLSRHTSFARAYAVTEDHNTGLMRQRIPFAEWHSLDLKAKVPKNRVRAPRTGDYYAVPLMERQWGYVQHAGTEPGYGNLVQALDLITTELAPKEQVTAVGPLFPPVFAYFAGCVRDGGWRFVCKGRTQPSVQARVFRLSQSAAASGRPGVYDDWCIMKLRGSQDEVQCVGLLGEDQQKLEILRTWTAEQIATRIATRHNPDDSFR